METLIWYLLSPSFVSALGLAPSFFPSQGPLPVCLHLLLLPGSFVNIQDGMLPGCRGSGIGGGSIVFTAAVSH